MAIFAPGPIADRITKALGLENCRSLKLSMEVGSTVAVVTEQYVSGDQLCLLAYELETNNWVLVSKKEYESNCQSLTTAEREAIEWFAEVQKPLTRLTQSHNREKYKDTLRGLLERLK